MCCVDCYLSVDCVIEHFNHFYFIQGRNSGKWVFMKSKFRDTKLYLLHRNIFLIDSSYTYTQTHIHTSFGQWIQSGQIKTLPLKLKRD